MLGIGTSLGTGELPVTIGSNKDITPNSDYQHNYYCEKFARFHCQLHRLAGYEKCAVHGPKLNDTDHTQKS